MKILLTCGVALLLSPAVFGSLIFTVSPSTESSPPGSSTSTCQLTGTAPCVVFSGTLSDPDTDSSFTFLNSISVNFTLPAANGYFTVDNTFFDDVPGALEGDTNNNPFPNSYTGPIFGLDFASSTPPGVYQGMATISASGGTNDPNGNGFTESISFTVDITPEPASELLIAGGLVALAAAIRLRRA
jgi:hypothetical protein